MPPIPRAQYRAPGSRRGASISNLILQRGAIQGRSALTSGGIWGDVARDVGAIAGSALQQRQQKREEQKAEQEALDVERERDAAVAEALGSYDGDAGALQERLTRAVGPVPALNITKARVALDGITDQRDAANQERLDNIIKGTGELSWQNFQEAYTGILEQAEPGFRAFGIMGLPEAPTRELYERIRGMGKEQPAPGSEEAFFEMDPDSPEAKQALEQRAAFAAAGREPAEPEPTMEERQAQIRADATTRAEVAAKFRPPTGPGEATYVLDRDAEVGTDAHVLKTPEEVAKDPERYGRPLLAAPTDELRRVETNLFAFKDIQAALQPVLDKVGPVEFTLRELQQKAPFLESDPAFRAFQQMVNALTNEEIRRITGAQMSAAEATRLKKGMADGSLRLPELKEALYLWQRGMERTRAGLMGNLKEWSEENPYTPTYFHGDSSPNLPAETQNELDKLFPPGQ